MLLRAGDTLSPLLPWAWLRACNACPVGPKSDRVRSERAQSGTWGTSAVKGGWEKSNRGKGSRKSLRDRKEPEGPTKEVF